MERRSLDTLSTDLAYAMKIEAPLFAAEKNEILAAYIDEKFGDNKVDRVFMYNPDAIAEWVYEKYPELMLGMTTKTDVKIPFETVVLRCRISPALSLQESLRSLRGRRTPYSR